MDFRLNRKEQSGFFKTASLNSLVKWSLRMLSEFAVSHVGFDLIRLTDLALLAVQVELMLADGHGPDGFDEGRTGVPGMHSNATVTKRPSCHRRPTVGADTRPPYIH